MYHFLSYSYIEWNNHLYVSMYPSPDKGKAAMKMIHCPNCDETLPENANYCAVCGESMTSPGHQSIHFIANQQTLEQQTVLDDATIPLHSDDATVPLHANESDRPVALKVPHFYAVGDLPGRTGGRTPAAAVVNRLRPATVNTSRRSRSGVPTTPLTRDPLINGVIADDEVAEEHKATWHKEVRSVIARDSAPMAVSRPSRPSSPHPIILTPQSSRRTLPTGIFFWVSFILLVVLVLGGVFGVVVTLGRGIIGAVNTGDLTLQVSPGTVAIGATVTLRGTNFSPRGHIGLARDTAIPLVDTGGASIVSADDQGNFSDTVVVSSDWGNGAHVISAEDAVTHKLAQFTVLVNGQGASLRPAHLLLSQQSLDLGTGDQATNSTRTITLSNVGGGLISWQGSATQPWLLLAPKSGTFSSGQHVQVTIAVDRSTLKPGPYTAQVIFASNAGDTTLPVRMQVTPLDAGHEAVLGLTPAVLSFTGTDGATSPAGQNITINNLGVRTLPWSATSNSSWLSVSPQSGSVANNSSQTVTINVDTSTLLPGTYNGILTVTGHDTVPIMDSPQSITVSITITPQCSLQTAPGTLSFASVYQQAGPTGKTVSLGTSQGCTTPIKWSAVKSADWITLNVTSGTTPTYPIVSVNTAGLTPGTYNGSVVFSSANGTQTLPITFVLGQPTAPILSNPTTGLKFAGVIGQPSPVAQAMTITNSGGGTLNWKATVATAVGGNWLTVAPATGSLTTQQSASITVTATLLGSLIPGTYNATITLTGTDSAGHAAAGTPQTIPIAFTVQAACTIAATPLTLTFAAVLGSPSPAAQPLTITASGACTHALTWIATVTTTPAGGTWLVPAPATGAASLAAAGTTNVGVVTTGLVAGTYSGTLTISAKDSVTGAVVGKPQAIPATLTVQPACTLQAPSVTTETFKAEAGASPAPQTFTLGVLGACKGNVLITPTITLGAGAGWITVTPNPATILTGGTATFTVTINSAALTAGSYTASISLAGVNGGVAIAGSPQTVGVALTVSAPPILTVSPASLTINITTGTTSTPLTIGNSGGSPLNWTATLAQGSAPFVSLSAGAGANLGSGTNAATNVVVDASGVNGGQAYTGTAIVSAVDPTTGKAIGTPISIPVTINVAAPAMQLSTQNLTFTTDVGTDPAPQSVVVNDTGGNTLKWTAGTPSASWLSVGPANGSNASGVTLPMTFAVVVNGLAAGTYNASVVVTPSVGAPVTVTVVLTVNGVAPTPTPTPTTGPTPTPTPTTGPTPTPSPTVGPTPTPTTGITPTATQGPTPTPTVGITPTATVDPTPTP